ncbi:MAG TPA: class I SAM-dependent methyltransferase [Solirubrobacterales bacterium]|nr:class I SAM-dependent methyltransferase [Solirubrobacterales bacterium]
MRGREIMGNPVKETYDSYAPVYDLFNHRYMYRQWTRKLLAKAEEAGMGGKRLLDIACGTGMSTIPMLDRGWEVTGCDISPAMLDVARSKVGTRADLFEADMRNLPDFGEFDLVWAVSDPVNYLLGGDELKAAFDGMRRNLAPSGVALFDANTLVTYATFFSKEIVVEEDGKRLVWLGLQMPEIVEPGMYAEARFEAEGNPDVAHVHRQRHFSEDEVLIALDAAGLHCISIFGELNGALTPGLDENHHTKAVYLCRRG